MNIKFEQLKKYTRSEKYDLGAAIADQIEWRKIKQWSTMADAIDCYLGVRRYAAARDILVYAYNRGFGGRRLLITLTQVYIQLKEFEDARELYEEFVEKAPRDNTRFTLLYQLRSAEGAPVGELIDILEEYKAEEPDDMFEYELACLYAEAGLADRCVKECDELVLWFADGEYVEKALKLKQHFTPLSESQEKLLERLEYIKSNGLKYDSETEYDSQMAETTEEMYAVPREDFSEFEQEAVQQTADTEETTEEQYSEEVYPEDYPEANYPEEELSDDSYSVNGSYEENYYSEETEKAEATYEAQDTEAAEQAGEVEESEEKIEEEAQESEKEAKVEEPKKVDISNTTSSNQHQKNVPRQILFLCWNFAKDKYNHRHHQNCCKHKEYLTVLQHTEGCTSVLKVMQFKNTIPNDIRLLFLQTTYRIVFRHLIHYD